MFKKVLIGLLALILVAAIATNVGVSFEKAYDEAYAKGYEAGFQTAKAVGKVEETTINLANFVQGLGR